MTEKLIESLVKKTDDKAKDRENLGIFSGILGIICNTILCIAKFIVGSLTRCVSITADAINNLSDAASSVITLVGTKIANKPIDKDHPFGHGRIEYVSALIVAFLIFLMGFELGKDSIAKIINPEAVEFNIWFIIILAAAILVKLWMARANGIIYKKTDNLAMKAVRQDCLNDCLATGATIVALVISHFTRFKIADGVIGVIVAIIIVLQGIDILKDVIGPLLGQVPDKELVKSIEDIMMSSDEVLGVHDLIVHDYGAGRVIASAHAEVSQDGNILDLHEAIDALESRIVNELNIFICIHMDPIAVNDEEVDTLKKMADEVIGAYNSEYTYHDFRVVKGDKSINLIFDLVVPIDKNLDKKIINEDLTALFRERDPRLNLVLTIEHSFI